MSTGVRSSTRLPFARDILHSEVAVGHKLGVHKILAGTLDAAFHTNAPDLEYVDEFGERTGSETTTILSPPRRVRILGP